MRSPFTLWEEPMLAPKDRYVPDEGLELHVVSGTSTRRRLAQETKRTLDILLAVTLLVPGLPVMGVLAFAVWVVDRQFPFYADRRVGLGGRRFGCLDPKILETYFSGHPGEEQLYGATRKLGHDPRITRVGRLLRKTSLDELPQLFHVLLGHMSVVGPRPLSPREFDERGASRFILASVRPGMTGLWQVSGRSDLDPASRVLLDNYYARNWSVWMDARILALTPIVVLTARGAR
jgi:lipopolysaccharide/colanic/teichoic acid biosynthesis glycosyltransferase